MVRKINKYGKPNFYKQGVRRNPDIRGREGRTLVLFGRYLEKGEPWFCLADICRILEIRNAGHCKSRLDQRGIVLNDTPTYNQFGTKVMQRLVYINEKNLYKVIMRSDKPQAEGFQDWVCGEVLPPSASTEAT